MYQKRGEMLNFSAFFAYKRKLIPSLPNWEEVGNC